MAISDAQRFDAYLAEGPEPLALLKIEHADMTTIRLVNNLVDITSGGDIYTARSFEARLPDSIEDAPGRASIRIDNISREMAEAIRLVTSAPDVTIEMVRQDAPDVIEWSWPPMKMINVKWNAATVAADLEFENLAREKYPFLTFSPAEFPGVVQ